MFSFVSIVCESILEDDFVVEDQNMFLDNPQDTFEQGKWILPLHFCCTQIMHTIMFNFVCLHKFDGICLNRIT
jgi:hypothetical protein